MFNDITMGNAPLDSREFHHWFIGDIKKWCTDSERPFERDRYRLRYTKDIEFKWGVLKKGEERPDWAPCSNGTAFSILVKGHFIYKFRNAKNPSDLVQYELKSVGDYIMWKEDVEHHWETKEDSVLLTIRWKERMGEPMTRVQDQKNI